MLDKLMEKYKWRNYDFSKAVYVNTNSLIPVICPRHGEFTKSFTKLYHRGQSCPDCSYEIHRFIKASKSINTLFTRHKGKFYYEIIEYTSPVTIEVLCPTHGKFTTNVEANMLSKHGCPKCGIDYTASIKYSNTEEFINKAKILHKEKYTYDKTVYKDAKSKVIITCPDHGDFEQLVSGHLSGYGCVKCASNGRGRVDFNKPCYLYYFNISGTNLHKIGITSKSISERYRTSFDRDQINLIFIKEYSTGREAYQKEQELLTTHKKLIYSGERVMSSGHTEIFISDIFNGDYTSFINTKASK